MKKILAQKNLSTVMMNIGTIIVVAAMLVVNKVNANSSQMSTLLESNAIEFTYQGQLVDTTGNPLSGNYDISFYIYNTPTGGTPLWEEVRSGANAVPIKDGLFSVILGSLNPIPSTIVDNNEELFLGIKVSTDNEMVPRVKIIEKFLQGDSSSTMPVGSVISWWRPDSTTPLPSGEWMIADGSVVTDSTSPLLGQTLPDLRNKFIMGVNSDGIGITGGTNTLNLSHQHVVDSHSHSIPSHTHSDGTLYSNVSVEDDRVYVRRYGPGFTATNANYTGTSHSNTHITDASADVGGATGAWSGTSGSSSPSTSLGLSSTTDNRPEYVGMIYLVKVK